MRLDDADGNRVGGHVFQIELWGVAVVVSVGSAAKAICFTATTQSKKPILNERAMIVPLDLDG